jgi:hypothetical protein
LGLGGFGPCVFSEECALGQIALSSLLLLQSALDTRYYCQANL